VLVALGPAVLADEPSEAPRASESGKAWLGVMLADAVDGGVRIAAVVPGGPAELAGLRAGDLILVLEDREVSDRAVVDRVISAVDPGAVVAVRVLRDGEIVDGELTTATRPASPLGLWRAPRAPREPVRETRVVRVADVGSLLEARLENLSPELREHYGAPGDTGVLVVRLEGGDEPRVALEVGDVVVRVCGQPVRHPGQLSPCVFRPADEEDAPTVEIVRGREPRELQLEPPPGYAPTRPRSSESAKQVRIRLIEAEIARLEKRLADLRRDLEALR
jgi:S1-C subfamily serine protease